MNIYKYGRVFEYQTIKKLREEGYFATRTGGSHGLCDVIALKDNEVRLIQCKRQKLRKTKTKGNIIPKLKEDRNIKLLKSLIVPQGVTKEIWIFTDRIGCQKEIL